VPFYPVTLPDVTPAGAEDGALGVLGMVAVGVRDLASPARPGSDGRTALTVAGAGKIRTGDVVVFCKPVAVARGGAPRRPGAGRGASC